MRARIEILGEHFRDIKITRVTFSGVRAEELPEKYLKEMYTHVIEKLLKEIDEYAESVEQHGAAGTREGYGELFSVDPEVHPPRWMRKIWGYPGTDDAVLMRLRELREGYRQVMEEMGLIACTRAEEPLLRHEPVSRPMRELTYRARDSGRDIVVGKWQSEESGDERLVTFEPIHSIPLKVSAVGVWLEKQIAEYGRGVTSEEGEATVYIPKRKRFGKLLGQISWAYFTLLKENNLL